MSSDATPNRIVIVGATFGFPNGTGATARARCYATGLRDAGARVYVVVVRVLRPGDPADVNPEVRGEWSGIEFEHASGTAGAHPTFVGRRLLEIRGLRRLWQLIRTWSRDEDLAAVILFGEGLRWVLPIRVMCSLAGVRFVAERSEHPFAYAREAGPVLSALRRLYLRWTLRMPDGYVAISSFLEETLAPFLRHDAWMLRVPIMVDAARFAHAGEPVPGVVAYAGHLGHSSELDDLLEAAAPAVRRDSRVTVRIIGPGTDDQRKSVMRRAEACGIADNVCLVGAVDAEHMPEALSEASVLVLARANGLFSRAGMPTKLGEYLATARPVVVTATGDIPLYLHDGVDSYLVPPSDVQRLSEAIDRALSDPGAASVGAAGRKVAQRNFDPRVHMERLLEVLLSDGKALGAGAGTGA